YCIRLLRSALIPMDITSYGNKCLTRHDALPIFKVVSDGAKFFGVDAKLDNLMHLPFLRNALRGLRQWCAAWQLVQLHRLADHDELQPLLGLLADVVLRWLLARC